jgi:hypothetical protein
MSKAIHMQDQVKNRIEIIMHDNESWSLDDIAQTAVSVVLVMVFLTIGIVW